MSVYDEVALHGAERETALAALDAQFQAWGLTMPPVKPLVNHFGLNRFYEIGLTEYWIANEIEIGYCGKFLFVFDGQTCPFHKHELKHETFFVTKGSVRMKLDDEEKILTEGDLLVMPPGVGHSFTGIGPALLLECSTPSVLRDNYFADKTIGGDGVL
jgi:mannose-6-phosphate isomerase-like protein (cupin superfamily)